ILQIISWLPAHSSKLAVISFAASGNLLATASERSAVIKVFNWFTCTKYRTFRRGYNVCPLILNLNFTTNAPFLTCTSVSNNNEIFNLSNSSQSHQLLFIFFGKSRNFNAQVLDGSEVVESSPNLVGDALLHEMEHFINQINEQFRQLKSACSTTDSYNEQCDER
ncbi:unnamed protein product, partial [Hymenolepis diminuta]